MMTRHQFVFGTEKTKDNKPISPHYAKYAVDNIIKYASMLYGGCTAIETQGGWINEQRTYVDEKGICLWADTDDPQASDKAAKLAHVICDMLDQACVTYTQIPVSTQFLSRRPKSA